MSAGSGLKGKNALSPHLLSFSHLSPNPVCEIRDVSSSFLGFSIAKLLLNPLLPPSSSFFVEGKKKRNILRMHIYIWIPSKREGMLIEKLKKKEDGRRGMK